MSWSEPEGLGGKPLRSKAPKRMQDRAVIPVGNLGFGPGRADAVNGGEQQIVGGGGTGAGLGPKGGQQVEYAGTPGGDPERAGQAEVERGGRERDGRGAILDQSGDVLGGAEISLVDDPGFAVDACAFNDVVVELVGFLLDDERGHTG